MLQTVALAMTIFVGLPLLMASIIGLRRDPGSLRTGVRTAPPGPPASPAPSPKTAPSVPADETAASQLSAPRQATGART
jgi:hypothetical protein